MSRIPDDVIAAVNARSCGRCECPDPSHAEGCSHRPGHYHHRRLRSQGGLDGAENLLYLCVLCHNWAHHNRTEARELGMILHAGDDEMELWR